jgi:hypothetical protein
VLAHGHHGCTVEDDQKTRHKVPWTRVLGLKKRAVKAAKVIDRGEAGSIVEHEDGRRVFIAGDLGLPEDPSRLDLAGLEDKARTPKSPKLADRVGAARGEVMKGFVGFVGPLEGHECEGPALCRICRSAALETDALLVKAMSGGADVLEARVARLVARAGTPVLKSLGAGSSPIPLLLRRRSP